MKRILTIAIAIQLLFLAGCQESTTVQERPAPKVVVEEIRPSAAESRLQTKGLVIPWKTAKLSFQTGGKIEAGPLELGTAVKEGAVLARLDDADYRTRLEAAQHQKELAEVESGRAGRDLKRYEQLFREGAISPKDLDDALDQYQAALANAGQAGSALKQADLMVRHCTLTAPFAGIILERFSEQGEMVAAGTPILILGQTDRVKVVITVSADQVNIWREGTTAVVLSLDKREFEAEVYKVSPAAQGYTGSFEVELAVANRDNQFSPGQVVAVERQVESGEGLWVPLKAVISRGEELKYIFTYNDSNSSVNQRPVKLGALAGDKIKVIEGLQAGERVVVMMPENLRDGDRVEVK